MQPLRFCHITTFYPPHNFGGDGIGIERLSRALVARGHRVHVVYDRDAYDVLSAGRKPAAQPAGDGIERTVLSTQLPMASLLLTQQLGRPIVHAARLHRLLREGDFDVINFHNASLMGAPALFSYGRGIKLYMAHEHWLVCPTHVLYRNGREPCQRRTCLRCTLHYKRPPQLWRYTHALERAGRHVDAFIAMSRFSRDKHAAFGFPFPMHVMPYFLPDPPAQSEQTPSVEDSTVQEQEPLHARPYFLFVGRLERIKGLQDVIPLFAGSGAADLLVAGDGDFAPALKAQAAGMTRVGFLGRVMGAQLEHYYRHALALIVPSLCYETFGIILIEAFRQHTPVIARRIGPLPEIVEAAGAGELFATQSELATALQRLQADPQRRELYARKGYEAYVRNYCERAVVPRYFEIIRTAAQRKGDTRVLAALDA